VEEKRIPARVLRILVDQVDELMGARALRTLFAQAGLLRYDEQNLPPRDDSPSVTLEEYGRVLHAIRQIFGPRGARALMLKGGRAAFEELRGANPARYAVLGTALKMLPEAKRIQLGLRRLIEEAEEFYGNQYHLLEERDAFVVEICNSPYCLVERREIAAGRPALDRPICDIPVGAYAALVEWVTGKPHRVEEIDCMAMGAPVCRIRVEKASG
jgi:predicted hydrocarbon binding protein